jgi:membrane protein EpsK
MSVSMLISLWVTPFLINRLELAAYGYIGVLNNILNFMAVITITLTSMVGRFLIVSLETKGPDEASRYISSALFTSISIGICLTPIILFLSKNLDSLLRIQNAYTVDVKAAFALSGTVLAFGSVSTVFATGAYCRNRLDIRNGINILANIVRVVILISVFSLFPAHIWYLAIASVFQESISMVLHALTFRKLLPEIRIRIKSFVLDHSVEVLSSGLLISIIMLGNNFLTQIDLLVGNRYLPAELVGMYAAVLLLPNSIRNIGAAISSAFTPTTISIYSSGNMEKLRKYSNQVVKFCGFAIGWPVAIISGLAIPVLRVWLGKDYSALEFTILLMLLPLTAHISVNQLFNVQQATNKVKIPAIVTIIFGGMNLLLAIYLTASLHLGILGIVLSGTTINSIRTIIFVPLYTAFITDQPKFVYYKGVVAPVVTSCMTCFIGLAIQNYIRINSLISIALSAFILSIFYGLVTLILLAPNEREMLLGRIIPMTRKFSARILHG